MCQTILIGVGLLLHLVFVSASGQPTRQRPLSNSHDLDYYSYPQLHWKSKLEGSTIESGNSVEHSPFDDDYIYITTKEANLMVLSASNGTVLTTISPSITTSNGNSANTDHTIYCKSGMTFGTLNDGSPFLIFAVVDEPRSDEFDLGPQTRVVAISIPDHKEIWSSNALRGKNSGSPVLFKSKDQQTYIALTHNNELQTINNTVMTTGYITVLRAEDGSTVWTETESSWNKEPMGYGPPEVAHNPTVRKYDTQVDVVVWASKGQEGTGTKGNLCAFQLPSDFDPEQIEQQQQQDPLNLTSIVLKEVRWTTTLSPVFGDGGQSMFLGVTGDQLRGWVNNTPFDATATWTSYLKRRATDDLAAIPVNPTLSRDGERLFVSTSSGDGFCIDTKSGNVTWKFSGSSQFLEAHVSHDDKRVYFFQEIDGRVFAYDQSYGTLQWVTSCDAFEEDCSNSVRASFSLSRTGQYLVYADVLGLVLSLKLGEPVLLQEETGNSGATNDSKIPQRPLSSVATQSPSGIPMGGSLALIFLSIFVVITSAVSLFLIRQARLRDRRKVDNAGQGSMKEEDDEDNDGNVDGVHQHEDSRNTNQIPNSLPIPPKSSSSWKDEDQELPNQSEPTNSTDKGCMATTIPPLPDDYSLGASMLL